MDESGSQNVECNLKKGEKVLKNGVTTNKEKICASTEQKLEESKLTFECNLASSAKNEDDNEADSTVDKS